MDYIIHQPTSLVEWIVDPLSGSTRGFSGVDCNPGLKSMRAVCWQITAINVVQKARDHPFILPSLSTNLEVGKMENILLHGFHDHLK
jgi:hypothetical protein